MRFVTTIGALLAFSLVAHGQVRQLNSGQQLDANSQIGSGGYNNVAGGQGGVNSQLYITGQTTGLTPFQGRVGYYAPNQLNLQLPSAPFDTFRGQSVGLGNIARGQTYLTSPYYNNNQTVLGPQGIAGGQTAPGTNAPINSIAQPVAPYIYAEVTKAYMPIVPDVGVPPAVAPPVISTDTLALSKYISSDMAAFGPNAPVFSGLSDPQRQQLARELYELAQREEPNTAELNANVNPQVNGQAGAPTPLPPIPAGSEEPTGPARRPLPVQRAKPTPSAPELGAAPTVPPNQDIFSDVLMKLYQERTHKAPQPAEQAPSNDLTGPAPQPPTPTPTPRPTANNAFVELRGNEVLIHSLAGMGKDAFNLFMASAQAKMKDGKFYAAYRDYDSALTINPSNPMALEGAGVAKFAAGEAYSAAFNLSRAIELFPPLMETRLDMVTLVDDKTFHERLAALDQRLAGPDLQEPLLLMLATFLHHNAAHADKAKAYAQLLKDSPKATKVMQAYAQYVLTGKRPVQPAILKAQPPASLIPARGK